MRMRSVAVLALAVLASNSGAEKTGPGVEGDDPPELDLETSIGEIVFECSYINHAWGHQHSGYIVGRDGSVRRYDRSGNRNLPESIARGAPFIPESELRALFAGAERYRSVPPETVVEKGLLLFDVAKGRIEREHAGYDMGSWGCTGYLYDAERSRYQPVPLGSDGDWKVRPSARAARALRRWLEGLAPQSQQE